MMAKPSMNKAGNGKKSVSEAANTKIVKPRLNQNNLCRFIDESIPTLTAAAISSLKPASILKTPNLLR